MAADGRASRALQGVRKHARLSTGYGARLQTRPSAIPPVAHGFDIVAVGIEDEGPVVVRMIVRPQARRAVVPAPRRERRSIERLDLGARLSGEGDMRPALRLAAGPDPEEGLALGAEAGVRLAAGLSGRHLMDRAKAEGLQGGPVKRLRAVQVGDRDPDVVEHAASPILAAGLMPTLSDYAARGVRERDLRLVMRMVDADADRCARLSRRDH